MDTACCVKQSDSPSTLDTYREEPDERNIDTGTNYDDTSKNAVDALEGAVSRTYIRVPESRNSRHGITTLSGAQAVTVEAT